MSPGLTGGFLSTEPPGKSSAPSWSRRRQTPRKASGPRRSCLERGPGPGPGRHGRRGGPGRRGGGGGRERGGGAARGRGAAAEEEEPGPPQPLTAARVNKPRRRGPAAAPARAGAGAEAEPCPGRRPGRGRAAAPPRLCAVTLLPGAGTAPSPGPPEPGSPLGRGAPEPPRRSPGKVSPPGLPRSRQPASFLHSPARLGPMPPPVSPGPQAVSRYAGAQAL